MLLWTCALILMTNQTWSLLFGQTLELRCLIKTCLLFSAGHMWPNIQTSEYFSTIHMGEIILLWKSYLCSSLSMARRVWAIWYGDFNFKLNWRLSCNINIMQYKNTIPFRSIGPYDLQWMCWWLDPSSVVVYLYLRPCFSLYRYEIWSL